MIPVVLHHGLFGFGNLAVGPLRIRYFAGGIERAIADRGHPLIVGRAHPTGPIELRARQLKELINRQLGILGLPDHRVIILAHSMGGLDARYMISRLGMADRVTALVTLSTPHHGSSYADWVVRNLGDRLGGRKLAAALGLDLRAIADLTTDAVKRFNDEVRDASAVRYFSVSACRPRSAVPAFLQHSHAIVFRHEGENDGVVSIVSAKWGEHLGTWPVDHLHLINKRTTPQTLLGGQDVAPRYVAILENLARRGIIPGPLREKGHNRV